MRSQTQAATLDHSGSAQHASRLLLLLGGGIYALWQLVHVGMMPDAVDPPGERLGFLGLALALIALSYHPQFRRHLAKMLYVLIFVGTAHYFSLVARNHIATPYLVGVFVALGSVSMVLASPRAIMGYSAFVLILAAAVALAPGSTPHSRIELVVGVSTVQIALAVSAWRNVALQAAARELTATRQKVQQLQGLLPICMHCNRIRTEAGAWDRLEAYIEARSEAAFTHSLCEPCLQKHYPE